MVGKWEDVPMYTSTIFAELRYLYPSFKGSRKLILEYLCQLGCRLDSVKIGNKTLAILIIRGIGELHE